MKTRFQIGVHDARQTRGHLQLELRVAAEARGRQAQQQSLRVTPRPGHHEILHGFGNGEGLTELRLHLLRVRRRPRAHLDEGGQPAAQLGQLRDVGAVAVQARQRVEVAAAHHGRQALGHHLRREQLHAALQHRVLHLRRRAPAEEARRQLLLLAVHTPPHSHVLHDGGHLLQIVRHGALQQQLVGVRAVEGLYGEGTRDALRMLAKCASLSSSNSPSTSSMSTTFTICFLRGSSNMGTFSSSIPDFMRSRNTVRTFWHSSVMTAYS